MRCYFRILFSTMFQRDFPNFLSFYSNRKRFYTGRHYWIRQKTDRSRQFLPQKFMLLCRTWREKKNVCSVAFGCDSYDCIGEEIERCVQVCRKVHVSRQLGIRQSSVVCVRLSARFQRKSLKVHSESLVRGRRENV